MYQKRKVWVEPLFGESQQWHGLRRFRLRGLAKVNCEGVMTATGQNLKRLLASRGWGGVEPPGQAGTGRQRQHPHRTARIDQMYGDDGVRWDGQSGHSAGNGWR